MIQARSSWSGDQESRQPTVALQIHNKPVEFANKIWLHVIAAREKNVCVRIRKGGGSLDERELLMPLLFLKQFFLRAILLEERDVSADKTSEQRALLVESRRL
ncbi:uncharacterized protein LOC120106771 isoform X2 [Phoenix dactylifera]|uniref:Uncharacterized protein LOC120106771 isoform X2 n=1 Tax=Phoenix dactylifera TaxID=42345 RepID=A0A8B8ZQX7_PHODC|nr:uncharacterized protein LOC120106771 isoform X2 [Phoenix dactylifera]